MVLQRQAIAQHSDRRSHAPVGYHDSTTHHTQMERDIPMRQLTSRQTRRAFLDYFVRNGHTEVPSASLIPGSDPTLLFTNAGMVPFKDTFLGLETRPYSRATTSQKVLRVSGKHNDLEEVGPSPRHHTFFEMLGNFSFGDYFKREAISLAWEFLTKELALPVERLWFTVFEGGSFKAADGSTVEVPADKEAERLWAEAGAAPDRVLRFSATDNFWVMGDTGPCGPCSEITIYIGEDLAKMRPEGVNSEDPDYVEIWNLVFMQFDRATMQPLPKPSVDTGMGFERICMVLQGTQSTYETDIFTPIIRRTMELTGGDEAHYSEHFAAYRAVADHTRACAFLIADGILPGPNGRSYVLRRLLRRAAYQGRSIGLERPFLAETARVVVADMGDAYPQLRARGEFILQTLTDEEERFGRTLASGLTRLDDALVGVRAGEALPGEDAFTLYDTFGFPIDLTQKIAADRGHGVDIADYEERREQARDRNRQGGKFKRSQDAALWADQDLPQATFTGYTEYAGKATLVAMLAEGGERLSSASAGQAVRIVLDATPFYAESGGQVGDTGSMHGFFDGRVRVTDTQRPLPGLIVHHGVVEEGTVTVGETLLARVDVVRRLETMRNHTATHLLHRVLRQTLGEHAAQAGSLVSPDRLRFDFTHNRPIPAEQVAEIERRVNEWIRADTPVDWQELGYQEALNEGAMALFGEKYGDRVRMVTAGCTPTNDEPGAASFCSRELCGGTHVARTGEIGLFRILSEGSSAGGIRRIEALTGRGADEWATAQVTALKEVAGRLGVPASQVPDRVEALLAELRARNKELEETRGKAGRASLEGLLGEVRQAGEIPYLAARVEAGNADGLSTMADWLRDRLGSAVIVLGALLGEKPQFLVVATDDLVGRGVHAGKLVGSLAAIVGGRGGGKPARAQGGGTDAARLDEALAAVGGLLQA